MKPLTSTKLNNEKKSDLFKHIFFIVALAFVLLVQGAIPFLTAPTLGQALWSAGFSQSFINESIFNIYARNFGIPEPAPISFGLSAAWPIGLLIRLGIYPIDAYTLVAAFWLSVGFYSTVNLGKYFGATANLAILGAVVWGTMPIIWANARFSMVSLGIALLPFYTLTFLNLFQNKENKEKTVRHNIKIKIASYIGACLISVFMDGYSFIMFAVGSTILGVFLFLNRKNRRYIIQYIFPAHILSLSISYYFYILYSGRLSFLPDSLDLFRALGVDLIFFIIPTKGFHWVMDFLGLSSSRSSQVLFGEPSAWAPSFCFPILIAATWAVFKTKLSSKHILGFTICALFGFYMSLGPSLKINARKPIELQSHQRMPEEYASIPTGSSILSEKLPGFQSMRWSNRWLALGVFSSWALLMISLTKKDNKNRATGIALLSTVTVLNLPDIPQKLRGDIHKRNSFYSLESDFIDDLGQLINKGETVSFLPWHNDFLSNYIASRLEVKTYNIGGDKNLSLARRHWPSSVRNLPTRLERPFNSPDFARGVIRLLATRDTDLAVFPYVEMYHLGDSWPYATPYKYEVAKLRKNLEKYDILEFIEHKYYTLAKLSSEWQHVPTEAILDHVNISQISLPNFSPEWSQIERSKDRYWLWSTSKRESSQILIKNYSSSNIQATITFSIYSINTRDLVISNKSGEKLWEDNEFRERRYIYFDSIILTPGENTLVFLTKGKPASVKGDPRDLFFCLENFKIYVNNEEDDIPASPIPVPIYSSGWHGVETDINNFWRWSSGNAEIKIYKDSSYEEEVKITCSVQSLNPRSLRIVTAKGELLWESTSLRDITNIELPPLRLRPGVNTLRFETDAPPISPQGDKRKLAFRLINFGAVLDKVNG